MDRRVLSLCLLLCVGVVLSNPVNSAPAGEFIKHVQSRTSEECRQISVNCLSAMSEECFFEVVLGGAGNGGATPALLACCGEVAQLQTCLGICPLPAYLTADDRNNIETAIAICN
mmetsp:Transcript_5286/g.22464  ORF Transcript_5286/g.22464 Transcript_5286/m.22464 type:complete len:115 (-) Transcript_5286:320-664(-)|eukprot:CAMPEP_0113969452 /NCGR_PEP_ID=MMETSP0011_2-20120614/10333_1 /TAXON_ID=101924 /ORGANISM="Rhodosorus marinus" /LENGTH=114 /DNA_ID=CAMNT_0000983127 /DNA_START=71 /DNA_END=415 /DNA_ORIENTATION=+ /assembly_acc=CAM_ASM_000156